VTYLFKIMRNHTVPAESAAGTHYDVENREPMKRDDFLDAHEQGSHEVCEAVPPLFKQMDRMRGVGQVSRPHAPSRVAPYPSRS